MPKPKFTIEKHEEKMRRILGEPVKPVDGRAALEKLLEAKRKLPRRIK